MLTPFVEQFSGLSPLIQCSVGSQLDSFPEEKNSSHLLLGNQLFSSVSMVESVSDCIALLSFFFLKYHSSPIMQYHYPISQYCNLNITTNEDQKIYLSYKFKFKSKVLQVRYPTTLPWRFIFVFTFHPRFASFPEIVWHRESVPKSK